MTANHALDILLIGGSGFVSGTLARLALEQGHQVWTVTRGARPLPAGVQQITVDRRARQDFALTIQRCQRRWQLVVDCIGYDPDDAVQDLALLRTYADHLVFISTDFVYDPAQRHFPQNEESDHYLSTGYGGQKRAAELVFAQTYADAAAWTILRPCHIYGPGSLLGCLPQHGRDPELLGRLRRGERLQLVGGGHFLQQPILAADLAATILSCYGNRQSHGQVYVTAGPDMVESRHYYAIIAACLGVTLQVDEIPVAAYRAQRPDHEPFLCHRIYDLSKLRSHGLHAPSTPLVTGLHQHVASLVEEEQNAR